MAFYQTREFWQSTFETFVLGFVVPYTSLVLTGTLWLLLPAWMYVLYRDQKEIRAIVNTMINRLRK